MGIFRKKKAKIDLKKKFGSFAFFFSIPVTLALAVVGARTLLRLIEQASFDRLRWSIFAMGVCLALIVFSGSGWQRLKTFLHELKHAVIVVLTGNRLTGFSFGKREGSVEYQVYKSNMHFEPFVLLAPYFFPLLSLPALIVAVIAEPDYPLQFFFILGCTLGIDGITAFEEYHPAQTDLQRIFGGVLVTFPFLVLLNLLWWCCCALWLVAGSRGYVEFAEEAVRAAEQGFTLLR